MTTTTDTLPSLDLDAVIKLAHEVVDERPDYVYEKVPVQVSNVLTGEPDTRDKCLYVAPDDTPSCVAAHMFVRIGVPIDVLRLHEGRSAASIAHDLDLTYPGTDGYAVADFLRDLQTRQDAGQPWGEALRLAELAAWTED